MNENEQRIAIAESLGAVCIDRDGPRKLWFRWRGREIPKSKLPDFPHDLDAMFEAWRDGMNRRQQRALGRELSKLVKRDVPDADREERRDLETNATAPWRAEAYLKVKGLWKE